MIAGKRILLLSPFRPWPLVNGTITRTFYLARCLSRGNKIFFAYRGPGPVARLGIEHVPVPNIPFRAGQIYNPFFVSRLNTLIKQEDIDLIIASHLWSGLHGLALRRRSQKMFVLDHHNVEFERFRQLGYPVWHAVRLLERIVCHAADQVICVSYADQRKLISTFALEPKVVVVENGADVLALQKRSVDAQDVRRSMGLPSSKRLMLFFGPMSYPPNVQAVDNLCKHVLPHLQARLSDFAIILAGVGTDALGINNHKIYKLGFVDDLVALIKSIDVVMVPLTSGSGTRLKILESVACGCPVVSTSIGAEGLDHTVFGDMLHIADDWSAFAEKAAQLALEKQKAVLPPSFVATYDWSNIWTRLDLSLPGYDS